VLDWEFDALPRAELIAAVTDESGMLNRDVCAIILCQHSLAKLDIEIFNGSSRHGPAARTALAPGPSPKAGSLSDSCSHPPQYPIREMRLHKM